MKRAFSWFFVLIAVILIGGCGRTNVIPDNNRDVGDKNGEIAGMNTEKNGNEAKDNKMEIKIVGSCNFEKENACVDYIGANWTEANIKAQCQGDGMAYSQKPCKYSKIGGCRMGKGTSYDLVTWSFVSPEGQTDEATSNVQKNACESLQVGEWITP